MFTLTKILVAGLATFGAVQAFPAPQAASNSTTTPSAQPSSIPAPSAPAASDQAALYRDLSAAPTAIDRLKRILTVGGNLLTGDALKKAIVFDFNGATPAAGAKGGATKAAVRFFPLPVYPSMTDLIFRTSQPSLSYTTSISPPPSASSTPAA